MRSPFEVVLTGDQPTGWSHFAGNAQFNGNADKIANILDYFEGTEIGKKLSDEFLSTFNLLGIDKSAAMLAHYTAIRSTTAVEIGTNPLFTPLMDSRFIALDLYNQKTVFTQPNFSLIHFLLQETGHVKSTLKPLNGVSQKKRRSSPFYGGVDLKPTKFRLYGDPVRFNV